MTRILTPSIHELAVARNIYLYNNNRAILGRVFQNGSLTRRDLYEMCPVFLDFEPYRVQWRIFALGPDSSTGNQLANSRSVLEARNYIILAPGA
jgi:hypothetical protein